MLFIIQKCLEGVFNEDGDQQDPGNERQIRTHQVSLLTLSGRHHEETIVYRCVVGAVCRLLIVLKLVRSIVRTSLN